MSTKRKNSKVNNRPLNKAANKQVNASLRSKNAPINRKVDRIVEEELKRTLKHFEKNVRDHVKIDKCMSPQGSKFIKLMDDPFNAEWADAKYPYYPGGQPNKSIVVRAYGVTQFNVTTGTAAQIYFSPNPGRWANSPNFAVSERIAYIPFAGGTTNKGIPGSPPFSAANATGTGAATGACAGYIRTGVTLATASDFNPGVATGDQYLAWDTASQVGSDNPDKPGDFSYRLIAAAIRLTPTTEEMDLGGITMSTRIAEASNIGLVGTSVITANSSAHWTRGSNTIEMKYLRSEDDDWWYYPSAGVGPVGGSDVSGCRHFIVYENGTAVTQSFMAQVIGFYEVKGVAANKLGTHSYMQPKTAGMVSTAMSIVGNQESDAGSEKKEFEKATELVAAKESPATKDLSKDAEKHSDFVDSLKDFVQKVEPVASKVIKTVAPALMALI